MKKIILTLSLLALASVALVSAAPVIVTNPALAGEAIDGDTIRAVFRGKKLAWENKSAVVVAVLKGGPVHNAFLKQAFNISASSFSNYWRLTSLSGGAIAPREFASEEELLQFVASTSGAIGYIDDSKLTAEVHPVALP